MKNFLQNLWFVSYVLGDCFLFLEAECLVYRANMSSSINSFSLLEFFVFVEVLCKRYLTQGQVEDKGYILTVFGCVFKVWGTRYLYLTNRKGVRDALSQWEWKALIWLWTRENAVLSATHHWAREILVMWSLPSGNILWESPMLLLCLFIG